MAETVMEAIATGYVPEAVEQWLDDHVYRQAHMDLLRNSVTEWDWVVEQVMLAYPTPIGDDAWRAIWDYIPGGVRKQVEQAMEAAREELREEVKA